MVDLSIIVLNYNTEELTLNCLRSIFEKKWFHQVKVTVVDNGSSDNSPQAIKKNFPQVELILNKKNLGFTLGNNVGFKKTKARYYMALNSDTRVQEKTIDALIDFMDRTDFGISGCTLLNKDGSFQPSGGDLPFGVALFFWISGLDDVLGPLRRKLPSFHRRFSDYYNKEREVGWVGGAAMVIRKETMDSIGYFDENIFMYGEDVEYCIRAKQAGLRVGFTNLAKIIHLGGGSSTEPSFKQWIGELKGLRYIYKKYTGFFSQQYLMMLLYFFTFVRMIAFLMVGRPQISKTYAKVLINI